LKILQICPGAYRSGVGGISEHVVNISERLAKRHDVSVYATNPRGKLPWFEVVRGVKVRRFSRFAPSGSYFFSAGMLANLRNECYDVVHGHGYHAFPMHSLILSRRRKLVLTTHFHNAGHTPIRACFFSLSKPIGKRILGKADLVIAVSEFEKRSLCSSLGVDPGKVVVVPNGLDMSEFAGLRRGKSLCKSILYVGRLERYKGVQHLVEVLPMLEKQVCLTIVGFGSQRKMLETRIRQLGLQDRVTFLQNLPRRQLLQTYVDADVLALLSEHEAYSMVIAEALVAGTPCVVADTSALSEWIDGKMCFGVKMPLNLESVADALRNVLRKGKGESVENTTHGKIVDWNSVVQQLEALYEV